MSRRVTGPMIDEVHLWQIPLEHRPPAEVAYFQRLLSAEENRNAEAFHFEKDRQRYAVARGALRTILAERMGMLPEALRFEHGPHGKPFLADGPEFNLSHCEDLALIVVAPAGRAVGVDVERVRPIQDLSSIEERYFGEGERALLAAAGPVERARCFLTIWTRREAAAKALGLNLQTALTGVAVPVYPPRGSVELLELAGIGGPWFQQDLSLDIGHVGALCIQGEPCKVMLREMRGNDC
jgi:4'-phosphopantetheinyl transferase